MRLKIKLLLQILQTLTALGTVVRLITAYDGTPVGKFHVLHVYLIRSAELGAVMLPAAAMVGFHE